jgi:hypothetical protein
MYTVPWRQCTTYLSANILVELVEELLVVGEDERVGLGGSDDPLAPGIGIDLFVMVASFHCETRYGETRKNTLFKRTKNKILNLDYTFFFARKLPIYLSSIMAL